MVAGLMAEPFDIKKLVTSPLTPLFWVKVVMLTFGAAFLFMVGRAVYLQYFAKPPMKQEQTQHFGNITVSDGAHLHLGQESTETKKWPWYIPHPFVDIYGYKENDRQGTGVKFGGHWEF